MWLSHARPFPEITMKLSSGGGRVSLVRRLSRQTRQSVLLWWIGAKPANGDQSQPDERPQDDRLSDRKRRAALLRGDLHEGWILLEGLHDQDEHVEVERQHRRDDKSTTPRSVEPPDVKGVARHRQREEGNDADRDTRRYAMEREEEPCHARRYGRRQKHDRPPRKQSTGNQPGKKAKAGCDPGNADCDMDQGEILQRHGSYLDICQLGTRWQPKDTTYLRRLALRPRSGSASSSALTQQAVSSPRRLAPNERRRRRPPHGRRTGTTGEWPPAPRQSPPAPAKDRPGRGPPPRGRVRSRCTTRGVRTRPRTRRRRRTSAGRRRTPGGPRCARGCGRWCDGRSPPAPPRTPPRTAAAGCGTRPRTAWRSTEARPGTPAAWRRGRNRATPRTRPRRPLRGPAGPDAAGPSPRRRAARQRGPCACG